MKIDKSKVKRILFITLSNIGDIVLTTPVISVLSERFPGARIDVMTGPAGADLFKGHPLVFKVIVYNKRVSFREKCRIMRKMRKVGYDLITDMRNSLFPFLLGARYRTSPIQSIPKSVGHKKQQHLWKLRTLGIAVKDAPFCLHIAKEDDAFADRIIGRLERDKPVIAVSPGAKSALKRWPREGYIQLVKRLVGELGAQVIIVGDGADKEPAGDIALSAGSGIINLAGRTTLRQLASILKKSRLLITNDSGPMHIGAAAGAKVLAIFGPTDHCLYGPLGNGSRVISKKIHCSPCGKAQCAFSHECMKLIGADEVFRAAKEMLAEQ